MGQKSMASRFPAVPRPTSGLTVRLPKLGWWWCIPILMAALLVRFVWLFASFTYDPITIVNWMRAMTHGGFTEVLASASDRIHLPLELYLLLLPGWFGHGPAVGAAVTLVQTMALRLSLIFTDNLAVAMVYRTGRKSAGLKLALIGGGLFALWPGSIKVDSWWTQTDIWYVAAVMLACWWLAREPVDLAWLALALGMALKWTDGGAAG